MANIKSLDASSDKWSRRAAVSGQDYQQGVANPRQSWSTASQAAGANYRAAVTAAAQAGKYETAVKRAGDDAWRQGAITKGPQRYSEGVALSTDKWQRGFSPYQSAISALTLPARGPRGSPANFARVQAVGQALRAIKDKIGGGK